jgi:hypothetical protein
MVPVSLPEYRLTIGELFPGDDPVARWVFSATAVAEDVAIVFGAMNDAANDEHVRERIYFYRQLITRLVEARRLVLAVDKDPALTSFAGPLLQGPVMNLREVYERPDDGSKSTVEQLYSQLRHRSVHYMQGTELRNELEAHRNFPAEIHIEPGDPAPRVEYRWLQVLSGMELFGDPHDPDMLKKMDERGMLVANMAAAWMMTAVAGVALLARRLGIDSGRLGNFPPPEHDRGTGSAATEAP